MNNFTDLLRAHNLKATPQRLAIVDILHHYGHITIEQLYEKMISRFDSISLATIYKNIHLMLDNSFVQEVKIPNTKSVYELTKSSHSHLVCEKCGSIEDISINIQALFEETSKTTDFTIHSASVVFHGICQECRKTTKG